MSAPDRCVRQSGLIAISDHLHYTISLMLLDLIHRRRLICGRPRNRSQLCTDRSPWHFCHPDQGTQMVLFAFIHSKLSAVTRKRYGIFTLIASLFLEPPVLIYTGHGLLSKYKIVPGCSQFNAISRRTCRIASMFYVMHTRIASVMQSIGINTVLRVYCCE